MIRPGSQSSSSHHKTMSNTRRSSPNQQNHFQHLELETSETMDEEDYCSENEENVSLMGSITSRRSISSAGHGNTRHFPTRKSTQHNFPDIISRLFAQIFTFSSSRNSWTKVTGVAFLFLGLLVFLSSNHDRNTTVRYTCPSKTKYSSNTDTASRYELASREIRHNVTHFLQHFRNVTYDDWGRTYMEVKEKMYPWKSEHFDIQTGGTMYESACGIGLNLFMTLEILQEARNVTDISVYGNDFVQDSVEVAKTISNHLPANGIRGKFCQAESTNLLHVPSDSFDLVFTGYITPLRDPLDLGLPSQEELDAVYLDLCESSDPDKVKRRYEAQRLQEEWYSRWVSELIRIAKPGGSVVVESVSYPLCEARFDWGGVEQDFFYNHEWKIDSASIHIADDLIMKRRYHVKMKKKK